MTLLYFLGHKELCKTCNFLFFPSIFYSYWLKMSVLWLEILQQRQMQKSFSLWYSLWKLFRRKLQSCSCNTKKQKKKTKNNWGWNWCGENRILLPKYFLFPLWRHCARVDGQDVHPNVSELLEQKASSFWLWVIYQRCEIHWSSFHKHKNLVSEYAGQFWTILLLFTYARRVLLKTLVLVSSCRPLQTWVERILNHWQTCSWLQGLVDKPSSKIRDKNRFCCFFGNNPV